MIQYTGQTRPVYKHDCERCTFLGKAGLPVHVGDKGPLTVFDLYHCSQGGHPTVIARFGDNGPDYFSGAALAAQYPALSTAETLAKLRGLPLPK